MKKTAKAKTAKKISVKALKKTGNKSNCFLVEFHKLPIVVALLAVILAAVYIMTSFYLPKKQAETYYLSGNNARTVPLSR